MKTAIMMICLIPLLGGCKSDLYTKLDEVEANQMMALLIYNQIQVEKSSAKEGISLRVDKERFVDAVEVLRQNGLPRRRTVTMEDLFPSGQLVSSPEQEAAKLNYLKSQQIEKMLGIMDGVIDAEVSVAEPRVVEGTHNRAGVGGLPDPTSVAVFIKYSPEVNLPVREAEIRALIKNGIPGLTPDRISLTLQRAEFRYQAPMTTPVNDSISLYGQLIPWNVLVSASGIALLGMMLMLSMWSRRRAESRS